MAGKRYYNIKNFQFSGGTFTSLKMVGYSQESKEVTDAGDNDQFESFAAYTGGATKLSIELMDPVQAAAICNGSSGTCSFQGAGANSSSAATVTITNATFGKISLGGQYGKNWSEKVEGIAANPDGSNPVTVTET